MPISRKQGESKDEFIGRCIAIEKRAGKPDSQAAAICYSTWEEKQLRSIKRIRRKKLNYAEGQPHYTADGKLWTGPTHSHNGRLMTGVVHTDSSQYLYHENELKSLYFESYDDYPKEATENAKIALRWADENGWGECATPVGKARANQLANGEKISEDTIARMAAFARHKANSQKELGDGCGRLSWLAWGGDAGIEWASRKLKQIRGESFMMLFEKQRVIVSSSNVDKLMYNTDTFELTIKFNDGSIYTYYDIDESTFIDVSGGNAAPITTGENEYGSWTEGVKPSVGAAVHQYLINKGVRYNKGGSFR